MYVIVVLAIFIVCLFLMETFRHAYISMMRPELKTVRTRLKRLPSTAHGPGSVDILRRRVYSDITWLNHILAHIPGIRKLDNIIVQANIEYSIGFFLQLSPLLALAGYFAGRAALDGGEILPLLFAVVLGYVPFAYLLRKKKQRLRKFERQLPEALELVARTLRAGQAFSGGLSIVSQEFDDPIATEFERTLDEINFGVAVPEALQNLAARVDCPDVKFFVVAVVIQRESGGNLSEIIENIAHVVRERFKLMGKIRVLSAEGKFSAIILCLLPFLIGFVIYLLNRDYIMILVEDPIGNYIIGAGLVMMLLGIIVMRQMIQIKV
ncbi:MAG: type II secretion system F family protein [Syntrophobacteraceae bacterium]|jgi:tight adherence protein B